MHISLDSALGRQRRLNSVGESVFQIAPDAAAGYSLRSLTGGDPSVVRVRRESDNGERDFNASGVSSGELVNWVNQQITPPLDLRELTATGRDGPIIEAAAAYSLRNLSDSYTGSVVEVRRNTDGALKDFKASEVTDGTLAAWVNTSFANALPLDTSGAAAAAYSLRNLSSSYTGSVVEVRRSSDGALRSFTAAEVTDGTLVAWVGAGNDGTVSKWYDQSGNDNHATQGTSASQPKIVSGGSLVTGGLDFDGTNDFFETSLVPPNVATLIGVANWDATGAFMPIIGARDSTDKRSYLAQLTIGPAGLGVANSARLGDSNIVAGDDYLLFGTYSGLTRLLSTNGSVASDSSGATPNNTTQGYAIGAFNDGGIISNNLNGTIQEVIVYNTDQSDKRRAIEENIGSTYGITLTSSKDGTVSKWYDQSTTSGVPNANHAVNSDPAKQPRIVINGELYESGIQILTTSFLNSQSSFTGFVLNDISSIVLGQASGGNGVGGLTYLDGSSNFANPYRFSSTQGYRYNNESVGLQPNSSAVKLFTLIGSPTIAEGFSNGTSYRTSTVSSASAGTRKFRIGGNGSSGISGSIKEAILYKSDQTDNRTALEANIGEFYGIAGIPAYDDTVNGFVETWYDQSGNGNNATQLTAGSQPKIVDAGALVAGGLDFDGVNDSFSGIPNLFSGTSAVSSFIVGNADSTGISESMFTQGDNAIVGNAFLITSEIAFRPGGNTIYDDTFIDANSLLLSTIVPASSTSADALMFLDGGALGQTSTTSATLNYGNQGAFIGRTFSGAPFYDGRLSEIIIYPSDQTANRLAIEANINNQYEIY